MTRTRTEYACLKASMDAARIAAWDRFVTDYTNAVDPDPADARARYRAELAAIEQELSS